MTSLFQPSHALTDPELATAFREHVADVRSELRTEGCSQADIDLVSDVQSLLAVQPYTTLFADLRRLRFRILLEWRDKQGPPGHRAEILRDLAIREAELSGASGNARLALDEALGELRAGKDVEHTVIALIGNVWRDDAAQAIEQRQVFQTVRRVATGVMVFFFLILCFQQLSDILYAYIRGRATLEAFRETNQLVGNLFASKFIICSLFGLVGALFSIWLDKTFSPPLPHWIVLRRSARATRLWGGLIVGLLVSVLAPVLLGEEFARGGIRIAPATSAAAAGAAPSAASSQDTDSTNTILRLYAFALALGFSQDVFFKKVRAFGGE